MINLDEFYLFETGEKDWEDYDYKPEVRQEMSAGFMQGGNSYCACIKMNKGNSKDLRVISLPAIHLDQLLYTIEEKGYTYEYLGGERGYYKKQYADKTERKKIKFAKKGKFIQKFGAEVEKDFAAQTRAKAQREFEEAAKIDMLTKAGKGLGE